MIISRKVVDIMIDNFKNKYFFLSNFYLSPVKFEGLVYPSVEHAFQAAKTLDKEERKEFAILKTPSDAKKKGRHCQLRSDWEEVKVFPEVYRLCANELKEGRDVIFDATSITPKVRARLINNIKEYYDEFEIGCYFFQVDPEICKQRVSVRNNIEGELYLPVEVIDSYHERLVKPTLDEGFKFIKIVNEIGEIIEEIK